MIGWDAPGCRQSSAGSLGERQSVRWLDAVDGRVNGHKAIYKAKHLLLREEGDIYYLKKRKTERHKDKHRERQRHVYTRQERQKRGLNLISKTKKTQEGKYAQITWLIKKS